MGNSFPYTRRRKMHPIEEGLIILIRGCRGHYRFTVMAVGVVFSNFDRQQQRWKVFFSEKNPGTAKRWNSFTPHTHIFDHGAFWQNFLNDILLRENIICCFLLVYLLSHNHHGLVLKRPPRSFCCAPHTQTVSRQKHIQFLQKRFGPLDKLNSWMWCVPCL